MILHILLCVKSSVPFYKKRLYYLTSSLQFDVNLRHINFLNLNFMLRKIEVQNLETRL